MLGPAAFGLWWLDSSSCIQHSHFFSFPPYVDVSVVYMYQLSQSLFFYFSLAAMWMLFVASLDDRNKVIEKGNNLPTSFKVPHHKIKGK